MRWRDERGRNRQLTFDRKQDAVRFDAELSRRRPMGPLAVAQITGTGATLREWRDDRWQPEHGVLLEDSTLRTYAAVWERHIEAHLGDLPLTQITSEVLRRWQAERVREGVQSETIRKARTIISSVLRHAAESGALPANPLAVVRAPKRAYRAAVRPLAPQSVERVRAELLQLHPAPAGTRRHTEALRDAAMVSLMAYAGLRPGELRALQWDDVRARTLVIERASNDVGRTKATKTEHVGTVRLLGPVVDDLGALRAATSPAGSDLVIGEQWAKAEWEAWRQGRWGRAIERADIDPRPRPYLLRHSFASVLLAEGRAVHYVAKQLRHTPAMTLSVYGHLFDEYQDARPIVADVEIARWRTECSR